MVLTDYIAYRVSDSTKHDEVYHLCCDVKRLLKKSSKRGLYLTISFENNTIKVYED